VLERAGLIAGDRSAQLRPSRLVFESGDGRLATVTVAEQLQTTTTRSRA